MHKILLYLCVPHYRKLGYTRRICPVVELGNEQMISLLNIQIMDDDYIEYVIEAARKVLGHFAR